jgi:hypothetical protein
MCALLVMFQKSHRFIIHFALNDLRSSPLSMTRLASLRLGVFFIAVLGTVCPRNEQI